MSEGPLSRKFRFIAEWLRERADRGEPVTAADARDIAATIEALLPHLQAMESRPVPPGWRLIDGGRDPEPPRHA